MTIIIKHRINAIRDLINTPQQYGVEIDLRSNNGDINLSHDPFNDASCTFEEWLNYYNHAFLILNVKEEGLEQYIQQILNIRKIEDFFFLDQSFPFLIRTTGNGELRSAVRYSEYESIETVKNLTHRVEWVWVDFFNNFPLSSDDFDDLRSRGFKVCVVSPELQGFPTQEVSALLEKLNKWTNSIDAVCTKRPDIWRDYYKV